MMNSQELFGADMLKAFDAATAPVNEAGILPPILYTSSEFHRFERDTIFTREWLCVGRTSQVPNPGDWYQFTLLDEPLLVVRDRDGQVRVLSAVCQHRGMVVAEGSGNCNKFLCPYHHTMVQKGLRSRFGPHGRYSWQEETLQQFNRWLVKRYRAHWPSTHPG